MSNNQDLIDQLKKYAGLEAFSIGFRMMLDKAANIIAAHEKKLEPTHWWDMPSELEQRTLQLCAPMEPGIWINARPAGNVVVHDDVTNFGFLVTRDEFIDGVYLKMVPERWTELMRRRKDDGLGAPENPAV